MMAKPLSAPYPDALKPKVQSGDVFALRIGSTSAQQGVCDAARVLRRLAGRRSQMRKSSALQAPADGTAKDAGSIWLIEPHVATKSSGDRRHRPWLGFFRHGPVRKKLQSDVRCWGIKRNLHQR